jgi:hypothetical protein
VVVFAALGYILLLAFRVGKGKLGIVPVAGGVRGDLVLCHTAFTGSGMNPTNVTIMGKNSFHLFRLHDPEKRETENKSRTQAPGCPGTVTDQISGRT